MGFKKYARKQIGRAKGYLKKRYAPTGRIDMNKVVGDLKKVKDLINSELKHKDTTLDQTLNSSSLTWNIHLLNGLECQDGDRGGEREGMKVRFKSLQIKGRIAAGQSSNANLKRVRVVIFIDKEPLVSGLGTDPVGSELYWPGISPNYVHAMRNWDSVSQKRFKVIYDRVHVVTDDYPEKILNIYKKLDMTTNWQNGYTAADSINNNAMYIAFSTDTPVGDDSLYVNLNTRMTYRDN